MVCHTEAATEAWQRQGRQKHSPVVCKTQNHSRIVHNDECNVLQYMSSTTKASRQEQESHSPSPVTAVQKVPGSVASLMHVLSARYEGSVPWQ